MLQIILNIWYVFCFVLFYFQLWLTKWVRHLQLHTHTQRCSACLLCWHREHLMFVLLLKWRAAGCLLPHSRRICHSLLNGSNWITAAWKGKRMLFSPLIFAQKLSVKPLKQWHRRKRPTLDSTTTENSISSFPDLWPLFPVFCNNGVFLLLCPVADAPVAEAHAARHDSYTSSELQSCMRRRKHGGCLVSKPYLISSDLSSSVDQCGLSLNIQAD